MLKHSTFLVVLLLTWIRSGNGLATKVLKCPCEFSVSREVRTDTNHETFDVIVSPVTFTNKAPLLLSQKHYERHSSRNLRVSDAIRTYAGTHVFRKMSIANKGFYRVSVHHHSSRMATDNPSYDLKLYATSRQQVCPVILEPDPPLLTPIRTDSSSENLKEALRVNAGRQPRIVGGLRISPTLLPYLVAIQLADARFCTGTLLSSKWIMTAAHCLVIPGSRVLVSTESNRIGPNTTVTRVFPHPMYDIVGEVERDFYDIAVAELETDLTNCANCVPAPKFMSVNFNSRFPLVQSFARVAGFGVPNADASLADPGVLRQVDVPVVNTDTCRDIYRTISSENQQICAGYLRDGGCDSCFQDSGGPLVQYAGSVPVLVGVTSFGIECALPDYPGVYVNTAGHRDFLESTPAIFTRNTKRITQVRRNCQRGFFLRSVNGETSSCTACPDNSISPGGPVRLCDECPGNMLRDTRRGNRCSCRALEGFGLVNGQTDCRECRAGFSSRVGQNRCIRCPVDTYAPDVGMAECLPCPGAPRGATTCSAAI